MTPALASLATPLLRRLDPERAHRLAITALRLGLAGAAARDDRRLAVRALGLHLPNPIGLAAGFDKQATAVRGLRRVGFGAVETGTVTLRPQPGNPAPRVFRLPADRAVINRYGLNSTGLEPYVARLAALSRTGVPNGIPVGANVGINKDCTDPERDYALLVAAVAPYVDYVVINVSSPNTPGLRDLQGEAKLRGILQAIAPMTTPLVIKLAPDMDEPGLEAALEVAVANGVRAVIMGNTTLDRPSTLRSPSRVETGGLSGPPLMARSTALLAYANRCVGDRMTLIGCGGITTGRDILRKLRAGASFVQLYTAFAYDGPAIIARLKRELLAAMDAEGFRTAQDAVGTAR